jgi:hypothetical protein
MKLSEIVPTLVFGVLIAVVGLNVLQHPAVGTTHHGIIAQEICNGPSSTSYVTINYSGVARSYQVSEYSTCLEFLFNHGRGVTVTDDAWTNRMASYRFD